MKVIDLDTAKTLLGIDDNSYDDLFTSLLPVIDAKVKQVCNYNFNTQYYGYFEAESNSIEIDDTEGLPVGTLLLGESIPEGASVYENYSGESVDMDENATETGHYYFYAGINISNQPIIAKGLMWLANNTNTSLPELWESKTVAPLSVKKGNSSEKINGKYGMPDWFIKALPRYQ